MKIQHTHTQTDTHTDKQTHRHTHRQTDRHTHTHMYVHTHTHRYKTCFIYIQVTWNESVESLITKIHSKVTV